MSHVTLHTTNGESILLDLALQDIRQLKRQLSQCFYREDGKPRPEPVGEVHIANKSGVWLLRLPASKLHPVIEVSKK